MALAWSHDAAGRPAQAEQICRIVLQAEPEYPDAWHLLGVLALRCGQHQVAADLIARAIAGNPTIPACHTHYALALNGIGRVEEALAAHRRAIALDPRHVDAYNNLGLVLKDLGRHAEAVATFRQALELVPGFAPAWNNLAIAYCEWGRLEEAAAAFRQVIALNPQIPEAHNNLGVVLRDLGDAAAAIESYNRALALRPQYPEVFNNLGVIEQRAKRNVEALEYFRRALELRPNWILPLGNLVAVLKELGETAEARQCCDRLLALAPSPNLRFKRALLLPVIYDSVDHVRVARQQALDDLAQLERDGVQLDPIAERIETTFYFVYQGQNDRPIVEQVARLCAAASRDFTGGRTRRINPSGRIRVAFVGSTLGLHTLGVLWHGLIARLPRDRFEVIAISLARGNDEFSQFVRQHSDRYLELPAHLGEARQMVADVQADILYYIDVGLDAGMYALANSRLAPVQCVTWGHPETTGLSTIDYYISSEHFESADAQQYYSEKLVRLKTLGLFVPPLEVTGEPKQRRDFDLPDDRHLYGCLQTLFKLHPAYDVVLAGILRRDPQGLLLLPRSQYPNWTELIQRRWRRSMPDVLERVRWLPWLGVGQYLQLLPLVDALLVPPLFGGGKTSYDAFSLGLPVVTRPAPLLAGRLTYGLYRAMGVDDVIAQSDEQYVDIAVRLGCDPEFRAAVRAKIRAASGRLFLDGAAVAEVADLFEQIAPPSA